MGPAPAARAAAAPPIECPTRCTSSLAPARCGPLAAVGAARPGRRSRRGGGAGRLGVAQGKGGGTWRTNLKTERAARSIPPWAEPSRSGAGAVSRLVSMSATDAVPRTTTHTSPASCRDLRARARVGVGRVAAGAGTMGGRRGEEGRGGARRGEEGRGGDRKEGRGWRGAVPEHDERRGVQLCVPARVLQLVAREGALPDHAGALARVVRKL